MLQRSPAYVPQDDVTLDVVMLATNAVQEYSWLGIQSWQDYCGRHSYSFTPVREQLIADMQPHLVELEVSLSGPMRVDQQHRYAAVRPVPRNHPRVAFARRDSRVGLYLWRIRRACSVGVVNGVVSIRFRCFRIGPRDGDGGQHQD